MFINPFVYKYRKIIFFKGEFHFIIIFKCMITLIISEISGEYPFKKIK